MSAELPVGALEDDAIAAFATGAPVEQVLSLSLAISLKRLADQGTSLAAGLERTRAELGLLPLQTTRAQVAAGGSADRSAP